MPSCVASPSPRGVCAPCPRFSRPGCSSSGGGSCSPAGRCTRRASVAPRRVRTSATGTRGIQRTPSRAAGRARLAERPPGAIHAPRSCPETRPAAPGAVAPVAPALPSRRLCGVVEQCDPQPIQQRRGGRRGQRHPAQAAAHGVPQLPNMGGEQGPPSNVPSRPPTGRLRVCCPPTCVRLRMHTRIHAKRSGSRGRSHLC